MCFFLFSVWFSAIVDYYKYKLFCKTVFSPFLFFSIICLTFPRPRAHFFLEILKEFSGQKDRKKMINCTKLPPRCRCLKHSAYCNAKRKMNGKHTYWNEIRKRFLYLYIKTIIMLFSLLVSARDSWFRCRVYQFCPFLASSRSDIESSESCIFNTTDSKVTKLKSREKKCHPLYEIVRYESFSGTETDR